MTTQAFVAPNCPDWCQVPPAEHLRDDPDDLEHFGHHMSVVMPNEYQPLAHVGPHLMHGAPKVSLSAAQALDGANLSDPYIMLTCDTYFTSEEARSLAAKMVELAELMDQIR